MKLTETLCILGTALIIASCSSSSTDPTPAPNGKDTTTNKDTIPNTDQQPMEKNVPAHKRSYDATRGGVQIVAVYYDQNANKDSFNLASPEEWLILQSDRKVNTSGWWLDAGDDGQDYVLPDTVNGRLYIFTRMGDVPASVTAGGARKILNRSVWIWNNSEHDTATVYDADNKLVDRLSY